MYFSTNVNSGQSVLLYPGVDDHNPVVVNIYTLINYTTLSISASNVIVECYEPRFACDIGYVRAMRVRIDGPITFPMMLHTHNAQTAHARGTPKQLLEERRRHSYRFASHHHTLSLLHDSNTTWVRRHRMDWLRTR